MKANIEDKFCDFCEYLFVYEQFTNNNQWFWSLETDLEHFKLHKVRAILFLRPNRQLESSFGD